MSFPIDDKFGAESQEDGRIKIIEIVDGKPPQEIGWLNPDGTSEITGEDGVTYIYGTEGELIGVDDGSGGMCVAEEDYFYSESSENCFTPNDSGSLNQSAALLAETSPQPTSHTDEPTTRTTNNNSHKLAKTDLPERPVFETQPTHSAAPAAAPLVIPVTTSHGEVVFLSSADGSTPSTQHVTVSVAAGTHVFGETAPAEVAAVTNSDSRQPVEVDRSDASVGSAVLCFAPQSLQDGQASVVVSDALPVGSELCDPTIPARMQDETSSFAAGAFSAGQVAAFTREGAPVDASDASAVPCGEFFAALSDSQPPRQGPAMAFTAEGAAVEAEVAGIFVGAPAQSTTRSEGSGLPGAMIAVADSAKQSVPNVNDQNQAQDQGNPDGNGENDGRQNQSEDNQHQQQNEDENEVAFA